MVSRRNLRGSRKRLTIGERLRLLEGEVRTMRGVLREHLESHGYCTGLIERLDAGEPKPTDLSDSEIESIVSHTANELGYRVRYTFESSTHRALIQAWTEELSAAIRAPMQNVSWRPTWIQRWIWDLEPQ